MPALRKKLFTAAALFYCATTNLLKHLTTPGPFLRLLGRLVVVLVFGFLFVIVRQTVKEVVSRVLKYAYGVARQKWHEIRRWSRRERQIEDDVFMEQDEQLWEQLWDELEHLRWEQDNELWEELWDEVERWWEHLDLMDWISLSQICLIINLDPDNYSIKGFTYFHPEWGQITRSESMKE